MNQNSGENMTGGSTFVIINNKEILDVKETINTNLIGFNLVSSGFYAQDPAYIENGNPVEFKKIEESNDIKIFNLESLVLFLNEEKDNNFYNPILDLIDLYNGTIGGCTCSKKARILNADHYFQIKITNLNIEFLNEFKNKLSAKKVLFKDIGDNLFFEI